MRTGTYRRVKKERDIYVLVPYMYLPYRHRCGHFGPANFILEFDRRQVRFTARDVSACFECALKSRLDSAIRCPRCERLIVTEFVVAATRAKLSDRFVRDAHYIDSDQNYVLICDDCVGGGQATYGCWTGQKFQDFCS
ncbi:MAG: hypothetical protein KC585_00315 [Candidatus Magasanikbacteria bacterium]|nr:hypothetical protein [Candidatus Magasanikbacteria bacterium]MCA9389030.1 hypothetical protein [Candidatus Magasanikbacteria bacterium]